MFPSTVINTENEQYYHMDWLLSLTQMEKLEDICTAYLEGYFYAKHASR